MMGSRNAVVALKPRTSSRRTTSSRTKQERRGGIETSRGNPRRFGWRRSRNAVVALKLRASPKAAKAASWKQERRGGIETIVNSNPHLHDYLEAGTPWWH